MVVIGTVQALSEYTPIAGEDTLMPDEVAIDPDEFMLVLTLIAP
jgi:hypothetical protein